ncbi:MAG TPA: hypothetical protein VHV82_06075 [Sporichthyaceae bacterium]|jgi:hypothetical protein|nr:hypothetical protein [Sporichthyaceae bacterium]
MRISGAGRTVAVIGVLGCALVGAGGVDLGAARPGPGAVAAPALTAGSGGGPDDLFDYTRHGSPIPAARGTARLVWSTTGPAAPPGQVMQLWIADAEQGGHCYALILPNQPPAHRQISGECSSAAAEARPQIPLNHDLSWGPTGGAMIISAPGADHLTLTDAPGTRVLPAAEGVSAAWLPPADSASTLILTSYDAAGRILATTTEPPVNYPSPPGPPAGRL